MLPFSFFVRILFVFFSFFLFLRPKIFMIFRSVRKGQTNNLFVFFLWQGPIFGGGGEGFKIPVYVITLFSANVGSRNVMDVKEVADALANFSFLKQIRNLCFCTTKHMERQNSRGINQNFELHCLLQGPGVAGTQFSGGSFFYSFIHSFIHPSIHSFIHSLIHSPR